MVSTLALWDEIHFQFDGRACVRGPGYVKYEGPCGRISAIIPFSEKPIPGLGGPFWVPGPYNDLKYPNPRSSFVIVRTKKKARIS